jgi:hypothetical protein
MTRSLTIRDYPAEVRTVQKLVERVFFIVPRARARPRARRSWVVARMGSAFAEPSSVAEATADKTARQALWDSCHLWSQKSHRVSGSYARAGLLMLFNSFEHEHD